MRHIVSSAAFLSAFIAPSAHAQSIAGAVLTQREPHHHVAFEDASLRVLRVHVAPHDTTLLHEHDPDYFWIALGASEIVNAKLGAPDAVIKSSDLTIHYTPGHFAHVARNTGAASFDNITVEVLHPQTGTRNLCVAALANAPEQCDRAHPDVVNAARVEPAFATDQLRVSLVSVAPRTTVRSSTGARVWLIALDTLDTRSALVGKGTGAWTGGVATAQGKNWTLRNGTSEPRRVLVVVDRASER